MIIRTLCACGDSQGAGGKRELEERALSCPSDCSCQAYFGECCETIGFFIKYFAYVIDFTNIPDHITEAEWRSAYPQFTTREQLQEYVNTFTWPDTQCSGRPGGCPVKRSTN